MNRDPRPAGGARGDLPDWLYPMEHAGRCYDQIGALSLGVGVAASPLTAVTGSVVQALLARHWPLGFADLMPESTTTAAAVALTPIAAAVWFLYRHWRPHRALALVEADTEVLVAQAAAMVAAGELDLAELLDDPGWTGAEIDVPEEELGTAAGEQGSGPASGGEGEDRLDEAGPRAREGALAA